MLVERLRSWSGPWIRDVVRDQKSSALVCQRRPSPVLETEEVLRGVQTTSEFLRTKECGQQRCVKPPNVAPLIGSRWVLTVGSFQMHKKNQPANSEAAGPRCRLAIVWRCALASTNLYKNKTNSTESRTPIQIGILAESSAGYTQATPPDSSKLFGLVSVTNTHPET